MSIEEANEDGERRGGGPIKFVNEVRAEARKVTWATRQEVIVSTIMVVVMGIVAAIFFFLVDGLLRIIMRLLLGVE